MILNITMSILFDIRVD